MAPAPPPLRVALGATVTPGDRLGPASRGRAALLPGTGAYVRRGHLHASLVGTMCAARHDADGDEGGEERWTISVQPKGSLSSGDATNATAVCPQVGALVVGRVNRVARPTHATVDIVATVPENNDSSNLQRQGKEAPSIVPFFEPFAGTLRQNELRPNSSLDVRIEECVRPGDVILARIHANGERDYILTTAEAELGVVQAICESSGCEMRPVSWKEMQCPVSGAREGRKVAKPRRAGAG